MPLDIGNFRHEPRDVGAERLRILADFLDTVPRERFNVYSWNCGTTACAIGWADTIAEFRVAGFSCDALGPELMGGTHALYGQAAIAAFFDISRGNAESLFYPDRYDPRDWRNPAAVAARIREHLAARVPA